VADEVQVRELLRVEDCLTWGAPNVESSRLIVSAGDALGQFECFFAAQLGPPHHFVIRKKKRKTEKERLLHVPYKPMTVVRQ